MSKNINLALSDGLARALRRAAYEDRRTQSEIIREAIGAWLDRRDRRLSKKEEDTT